VSEGPRIIQHGTAGGTAINVDVTRIEHSISVKVQLSAAYARTHAPGMPTPPSMTGAAAANLDYPRTIPSGTVLVLFKSEADALVAAGKASYV
jgi:hypothetical protein